MRAKLLLCFVTILFFLNSKEASAQTPNPVIWKTAYNEFSASDFYIKIGDTHFYGKEPIRVNSDPGLERTTLELQWKENGIEMRLNLYFRKIELGMWELYDLRTYNAQGNYWLYYPTFDETGNPVKSLVGQRDFRDERRFISQDGLGEIYCKDCSLTAFINKVPPPSVYGYILDFRIGIPQNETPTISTNPSTAYGTNAVLLTSNGEVVKDQSDFRYIWKAENEKILSLTPQTVPYPDGNCAYGILAPCPEFNVQIHGLYPGISRVLLDVERKSDKTVVASNAFSVKVINYNPASPTMTPTPTLAPTPDTITAQLTELQGEVGRLTETVQQQQKDIGVLQKLVQSLQQLLRRLFGWRR